MIKFDSEPSGGSEPGKPSNLLKFPPEASTKTLLLEMRERIINSDRIYFLANQEGIGDGVISSAYFKAFMSGLNLICQQEGVSVPQVTFVTNRNHDGLFNGIAQTYQNVTVMEADAPEKYVRRLPTGSMQGINVMVLDFAGFFGDHDMVRGARPKTPEIVTETDGGINITTLKYLFGSAINNYKYNDKITGTQTRYADFVEDLLSLQRNTISPELAQPELVLPEDEQEIYNAVRERNNLPASSRAGGTRDDEITVGIEASYEAKTYPVEQWIEVIQKLHDLHPNFRFNILYRRITGDQGDQREQQLMSLLRSNGVDSYCGLVSGSLVEVAIFLKHQRAMLGNDTGASHISGAMGTPAIALEEPFGPWNDMNMWRSTGYLHYLDFNNAGVLKPREGIILGLHGNAHIGKFPPSFIVQSFEETLALAS